MIPAVPTSLTIEHDTLHRSLVEITRLPGATGEAAREVARRLHAHFHDEEAFALPPLGLLAPLARHDVREEMGEIVALSRRLESELPRMLADHRSIVAALDVLRAAADREGQPAAAAFAQALQAHAEMEEQVMYPAAILVGRYVARALAGSDRAGVGPRHEMGA